MIHKAIFLLLCLTASSFFGRIPESTKLEYATKMYEGFILQSVGKARAAFYTFKDGYQQALQAGESTEKLEAINQLFLWYRHYGSFLHLMATPSGISDEYCSYSYAPLARIPNYESEWGNNPTQAARMRDLMFGFGEVISGVFCVIVGSPPIKFSVGLPMFIDGSCRIWSTLNMAWAEYELSLRDEPFQEYKKWEIKGKKAAAQP